MCLGEIVRLESVSGASATASSAGRSLTVSLVTLDEPVATGDWVVVHSGFALQRLDPDEAATALTLRAGASAGTSHASTTTHPQEES